MATAVLSEPFTTVDAFLAQFAARYDREIVKKMRDVLAASILVQVKKDYDLFIIATGAAEAAGNTSIEDYLRDTVTQNQSMAEDLAAAGSPEAFNIGLTCYTIDAGALVSLGQLGTKHEARLCHMSVINSGLHYVTVRPNDMLEAEMKVGNSTYFFVLPSLPSSLLPSPCFFSSNQFACLSSPTLMR